MLVLIQSVCAGAISNSFCTCPHLKVTWQIILTLMSVYDASIFPGLKNLNVIQNGVAMMQKG